MITYTCKPHLNDSRNMATFTDSDPAPKAGEDGNLKKFTFAAANSAVEHLEANGVDTLGNNLAYSDGMTFTEGLIGLLILGFCVWMIIRHPLKSLSFLFKVGFLLLLGFGVVLVFWCFLLTI